MSSDMTDHLEAARAAYTGYAWADAFDLYREIDAASELELVDLEKFAFAAALSGHDLDMLSILERLFRKYLDSDMNEEAAKAAFWSGFRLISIGEMGQANAWFQRSQRLVDDLARETVVHGYLALPLIHRCRAEGRLDEAAELARKTMALGERFDEQDLVAFAQNLLGDLYLRDGDIDRGIAQLDAAMLSATGGELSPLITGLVYCSVIAACCKIHAMDRAREWTEALSAWCESQPQLYTFIGRCMVHRSEISQLNGNWSKAANEAREAFGHLADSVDRDSAAAAKYQEGEIHRLRGNFSEAEKCYRQAGAYGMEPQPGYALLRQVQGRGELAVQTIRRVLGEHTDPISRARLLPAFVEITLANNLAAEAAEASRELSQISARFKTEVLSAIALQCRGQVLLARGQPQEAIADLRRALAIWHNLPAPYIAARIRVLIAQACLALDDHDGAALELEPARRCFEEMGAMPDLSQLESGASQQKAGHGLTKRETEVLGLIVDGATNRSIGQRLGLSTKTIDRHVGNILNKLGVSSRTEAAAFAIRERIL